MKIGSHDFVREMPALTADGIELDAELHKHHDGRLHVYFARAGEDVSSYDYTRIGYRDFDDESMLLGLRVASNLRGRDLGQSMVKYLQDRVEERGQTFIGTGMIYKPLVALTLKRAGMQPLSQDVMVEILPWSKADTTGTPKVQVIRNEDGLELTGQRPSGGHFYEVIPSEQVVAKYPINSPEMIVALHTRYKPAEAIH